MTRSINIQPIIEEIQSSLEIPSYSEHDKGFDDGLKYVLDLIENAPTLTPPNEPLTLDSRLTPKMVTCPKGWKGVRYTRFHCPGCKKVLKKGEAYCHKCGQALIFPAARYDKENNRIWLDFSDRRPPEGEEDT